MKRLMLMADALFDSRLGTILQMDPKVGGALLGNQAYRERDEDDWAQLTEGAITAEAFAIAYAARNVETLKVSPYTNILAFVARIIGMYRTNADLQQEAEPICLVLNTWPYEFNRSELDMLTELVNGALADVVAIQAVREAPETLTPGHLNANYHGLILYHFEEWLTLHQAAFLEDGKRCYGMDVICPRLFQVKAVQLSMKDKQRDIMHTRTTLHEYFSVDFLDARWFSLYDPVAISRVLHAMDRDGVGEDDAPVMLSRPA